MGLKEVIKRNEQMNKFFDAEAKVSRELLPKPVYYIESPTDSTVTVGMKVAVEKHTQPSGDSLSIIRWNDTSHERVMTAESTVSKEGYFAFKRIQKEGGGYYYFAPMTLDIFNRKVKEKLGTDRVFENEEEMTQAFLETLSDQY